VINPIGHKHRKTDIPAVHLEGRTLLSYGELAGESERVLRTHEYGADGHLADALRELLG